jgi:D-alanyl-D-alanine dipeptidase
MCERGVKAESAGRALDLAMASARIDRCGNLWKAIVDIATDTDCFSDPDSLSLPVVNGRGETVREFFK